MNLTPWRINGWFTYSHHPWKETTYPWKTKQTSIWGVSKNRGGPPKWMVKIMENPIKKGWFGGKTPYFRNLHFWTYVPAIRSSGLWFFSTKRSPNPGPGLPPVGFKTPIPIWHTSDRILEMSAIQGGGEVVMKSLNLGNVFKASYWSKK